MKSTLKEMELSPPVFVHMEKSEFQRHLHLLKNILLPVLNRMKDEFRKLKIGPLSDEFLNDMLFHDCRLIKSQVKGNKLSGLLNACKELRYPLRFELDVLLDFISLDENENIVLTDEAIQSLRDFHSIYAITEHGAELFRKHKVAATALNEFYQLAKENIGSTIEDLTELFYFNNEGKILPTPREYDLFNYVTSQEPQKH
ncbi:MAG: hypothetical protein ACP5D9_11955 [Mariniphaga sp.]